MASNNRVGKADIVRAAAGKSGLTHESLGKVYDAIMGAIVDSLVSNVHVNIPGLGTLRVGMRKDVEINTPDINGDVTQTIARKISARRGITLRVSAILRNRMNPHIPVARTRMTPDELAAANAKRVADRAAKTAARLEEQARKAREAATAAEKKAGKVGKAEKKAAV